MTAAAANEQLVAGRTDVEQFASAEDPPPSSVWLAAYAMGLVASESQGEGAQELLDFAEDAVGAVRNAMRYLEDPAVGDSTLRARARALLAAAVADVETAQRG